MLKNSVSRNKLRNYVLPEIARIEYDSLGPERPIEDGNSTPTCSKVRCSVSNHRERESCIIVIELVGYLCPPPHLVFKGIVFAMIPSIEKRFLQVSSGMTHSIYIVVDLSMGHSHGDFCGPISRKSGGGIVKFIAKNGYDSRWS